MAADLYYTVDGCRIHCLQEGSGKKDVLLLHGSSFQAATWQDLGTLDTLASHGFRATSLDLPGHGLTPACEMDDRDLLRSSMKNIGTESPVLVGPSMGGEIALDFALEYSGLIRGLILIGPVGVKKVSHRLSSLSLPALIVWGGQDEIAPLEHGHLLHEKIQDSRLVVLEQSPHPAYLEETERWHRELLFFLQDIDWS